MDVHVALVSWPADEAKRRELAERGEPRLLLVDRHAEPPLVVDHLEDWVRLPVSPADSRARVSSLAERMQRLSPVTPVFDRSGVLRYRFARIELSPVQQGLLRPLVDRFGAVVSRSVLMKSAWPDEPPTKNTLDVHMVRVRRRLAPHGLELRTVRSRGYLLTASDGESAG